MKMRFFELAKEVSKLSNYHTHKLAAIIVKGNRIISLGVNDQKTHPKSDTRFQKLHAELAAIIRSRADLRGASIYVYRETRNGEIGCSFPCSSCYSAIRSSGIKRIFFTDYNNSYKMEKVS